MKKILGNDEVKNFVLGGDVNNEYVRDGRF